MKAHIDRLDQEQRIDVLKEQLQSEETRQKLFKFLQEEFRESEAQILMKAMEGLTVNISYKQEYEKKKSDPLGAAVSRVPQATVSVCRNKASGKHFIHIDDLSDNKVLLISPDGVQTALIANLFDQPKDESIDYLLPRKLITEIQLEKFTEYESQQFEVADTSSENYLDQIKPKGIQRSGRTTGQKTPSPSAYEWCSGVPELSRFTDHVKWKKICDYLNVEVGGNSARRALRDWVRENRRGWPTIPEPGAR